MNIDDNLYLLEGEELARLRAIADRLQGGSDRERDEGHRLWLIVNAIRDRGAFAP
jgi:hypothetical protein